MKTAVLETLPLHLLKTFCVFAEIGRVEEAAQRLGVTQASVSLQLKKLEEEVGQTLFKTVGRKKLLSEFARDLFQSIAPPFKELELRLKEVSKFQLPLDQRILRIGCRQDFISRVSPIIRFPGQVQISSMTTANALRALKNDEVDVAIAANPQITGEWIAKKIFTDNPVLIANPKILKSRSWDTLNTQNLQHPAIAFRKPAPFLSEVMEKSGAGEKNLKIKAYCEDWFSIIEMVKNFSSWSVLPRKYPGLSENLTVIDIPSKVLEPLSVYAVYGKEWRGLSIMPTQRLA
jgi:DNA-binding transcriptional LysR family regulator